MLAAVNELLLFAADRTFIQFLCCECCKLAHSIRATKVLQRHRRQSDGLCQFDDADSEPEEGMASDEETMDSEYSFIEQEFA